MRRAFEKWLDEGWSPGRIIYGLATAVTLVVAVAGYADHVRHPGAVWWLLGGALVLALWALLEMARWRIRHNRLQRRLAEAESRLSVPPPVTDRKPEPLEPRHGQSPRYRHTTDSAFFEHRVGISNPPGNPEATGVRVEWAEMSPRPDNQYGFPSVVPPQWVPRLKGGDPAVGVSLSPGQEESWVIVSTLTASDGTMSAGVFGSDPQLGQPWRGFQWRFMPGDQWRFIYRVVADNLPGTTFSMVMTSENDALRCDLEVFK